MNPEFVGPDRTGPDRDFSQLLFWSVILLDNKGAFEGRNLAA